LDGNPVATSPALPRGFKPRFYDVRVEGITGGTAKIGITFYEVKSDSPLQYWDDKVWADVMNRSVSGNTISGDIPVDALHKTPIVLGT